MSDEDEFAAQEAEAGGGGAVKLTADVAPWEAALDKAAAKVTEWAGSVEGRFKAAGEKITGYTAAAGKAVDAMTKAGGGDLGKGFADAAGEFVGGKLGAVLGSVLGPVGAVVGSQLGAAVGANLGEYIAANVNAESLGEEFKGVLKGVDEQVAAVGETWASVKRDAQDAFDGVKKLLKDVSLADLFADGLSGLPGRLEDITGKVWDRLNAFGMQATARFADLIDGAWERFSGPLGRVADGIQFLLEKTGLIGESTEKWSDALDRVKDVGTTVVGALAYAFGTLEDVVSLVANSARVALFTALKLVGEQVARLVTQFATLADSLGVGDALGIDFKALKGEAEAFGKVFGQGMDDAIKEADRKMSEALELKTGGKRRDQVTAGVTVGREINVDADNNRMLDDFFNKMLAGFKPAQEAAKAAGDGSSKTVQAVVDGSREAARLAAADAGRGSGGDLQKQAADAAKANVEATKGVKDAVEKVNKTLEKAPPLKSV